LKAKIELATPVVGTPRVLQMGGMLDVDLPSGMRSTVALEVDLPLEAKPWNIGLIVGPSGCGKSSIARHFWPREMRHAAKWHPAKSVLDAFPAAMSIKDIVALLSSVGFSSPPAWLRPFHALSNGEQFRVQLARLLADFPALAVIDEFTSVVDRTVAQIGSAALAKTVRRRKQKLVAVTCHDDVERWLQPDWVYRPAEARFTWRSPRRRPPIELEIERVDHSAWRLFKHHHYLTASHSNSATCFIAFWRRQPVAWISWVPHVGVAKRGDGRLIRRVHRMVCLPDFQGVGIGAALQEFTSRAWIAVDCRAIIATGHPAVIAATARNPRYRMLRAPALNASGGSDPEIRARLNRTRASFRMTASFEYVGRPLSIGMAKRLLTRPTVSE
jgi:energy-coupling factor transporter ATP-binding protein EcfA2